MARVAQIGAVETNDAYNRVLSKTHVPVKLAAATPEDFELGEDPKTLNATILKTEMQLSGAASCIADRCAMWRWEHTTASVPVVTPGAGAEDARTFEQRVVRTHGYCGLAGAPTA